MIAKKDFQGGYSGDTFNQLSLTTRSLWSLKRLERQECQTLAESLEEKKHERRKCMTIVGILGTIHNQELREKYNSTLNLYKDIIQEFDPDIICGEVHPQSWIKYLKDKNEKGYWGEPASEYWELIFPLCEEMKIEFVPIDWFELDVWNNFDPFDDYPEEKRKEFEKFDDDWFLKQMSTHSFGRIPFNSDEFDEVTKQKYEWLYQVNPKDQNLRWVIRNQIMIQRVKNTYLKNHEKRILCIIGADHNYIFKEELMQESIKLIYPLR
ncbi:hypothetical protein ACP8HI_20440 [Paenibacillus sp. FA6]|uniref:hypothetical protein n=1 Tax=Paenibacillus sp. FA6 TaxID=3413029 RepID=UPI003F657D29